MNILDAPEAYGFTTFCDDIRFEVANKLTFVGIYTRQIVLYADSLPIAIPKLAMSINYRQRYDKMIFPIQFRIFLPWQPDEPIVLDPPEHVAPPPTEPAKELSERSGEIAYTNATFQLAFSPFTIMSPGFLKVRAVRGDDLVRLGGMEIVVQPTASNPLLSPQQPPTRDQ